jgi:hypothetical protein
MKQNFSVYSGNNKDITLTIKDEAGNTLPLNGATLRWMMTNGTTTVTKQYPNLSGNSCTIKLVPADTEGLSGNFKHEAELTDSLGNVSTVVTGTVSVIKTLL